MLPTIVLTCPLDGLGLGTKVTEGKSEVIERDGTKGGHLHLAASAFVCLNGHQWTVDMLMERVD